MLKSLSTSLIQRGILALAAGATALAWPGITVLTLVVLFAVYAFMASGLEALRAFSSRTGGAVFRHLLAGLIDLAAGVIALAGPGPTTLVLVLIVASWAVIAGLIEVSDAFGSIAPAGTRALFILGGLVSVAFGMVLLAHPRVGAITLALLFGLFNLVYGVGVLVQGLAAPITSGRPQARMLGNLVTSVLSLLISNEFAARPLSDGLLPWPMRRPRTPSESYLGGLAMPVGRSARGLRVAAAAPRANGCC